MLPGIWMYKKCGWVQNTHPRTQKSIGSAWKMYRGIRGLSNSHPSGNKFKAFNIRSIPCSLNSKVDMLANAASNLCPTNDYSHNKFSVE